MNSKVLTFKSNLNDLPTTNADLLGIQTLVSSILCRRASNNGLEQLFKCLMSRTNSAKWKNDILEKF